MRILLWSLYGLAAGSFANVYFYRIPKNASLFKPSSFCPECNHRILWRDNIPIISYLLLKGRCRFCNSRISLRYPIVELFCSILFVLAAAKLRGLPWIQPVSFTVFSFLLFLIGGIDFVTYFQSGKEYGIIPDHLILLLAGYGLVFIPFNPFFSNNFWMGVGGGFFGFLAIYGIRLIGGAIFKKEALGWGDVKMISAIGLWIGWQGIAITLVVSSFSAALVSIPLIRRKKLSSTSPIPYAPFLSFGALSAFLYL